MEKLKRVVIKEELVELTGDFRKALILNQFVYWSERVKDHDRWIIEEKERAKKGGIILDTNETNGWIYKTAEELNEELMLKLSMPTMRKLLKELISEGFIQERRNPKLKWDKTMQYRVDLVKVQIELMKVGYCLEGYKLLDGILETNKKATTVGPVEAKEVKSNSSNKSICNTTPNYTPVPNKNIQEDNNNQAMDLVKEARINIKKADMNEVNEKCTNVEALKVAINNIKGKSHGINALMSAYNEALSGNSNNNSKDKWGNSLKGGLGSSDMKIGDKSIKDVPSNDLNKMVEMVNQPYLYK